MKAGEGKTTSFSSAELPRGRRRCGGSSGGHQQEATSRTTAKVLHSRASGASTEAKPRTTTPATPSSLSMAYKYAPYTTRNPSRRFFNAWSVVEIFSISSSGRLSRSHVTHQPCFFRRLRAEDEGRQGGEEVYFCDFQSFVFILLNYKIIKYY